METNVMARADVCINTHYVDSIEISVFLQINTFPN